MRLFVCQVSSGKSLRVPVTLLARNVTLLARNVTSAVSTSPSQRSMYGSYNTGRGTTLVPSA